MALGLFLKVFVADILAVTVDRAYGSVTDSSALFLLIATLFFGIQIYCDFNGYTIIARGVAKVLGVDLVENFRQPYLSASISSFGVGGTFRSPVGLWITSTFLLGVVGAAKSGPHSIYWRLLP
jgi:hypothetical protein